MNSNNQHSDDSIAIHLLPAAEFDCSGGQAFDPPQFGGLESPIIMLAPVTFDLTVPHLVVTLRLLGKDETGSVEVLAHDVLNLVTALSEYEKTIGGRGLRLHHKTADGSAITLALAPILGEKASERLHQVAELLGTFAKMSEEPRNSGTPVLEAISRLEQSPAEQCKAAFVRREWVIEFHIAA
jgi:hypothetical protein